MTDEKSQAPAGRLWGMGRTVVVLGLISFLTDVSSEMIYPFIPLFLADVLGASKRVIGLIEGIAESTASVFKAFSGWLSDRLRLRKPLVTGGYGLAAVCKPLLAVAGVWQQVLAIRFFDRLGKGVRTAPRDALIADTAPEELRGRAFGFHRSMDTLGAVVGPLIAFLLLPCFAGSYRPLFLWSAVPALLGVLLVVGWIREPSVPQPIRSSRPEFRLSGFSPLFRRFLLISVLFAVGNSSDVFIILRAHSLGIEARHIPLLYLAFNLAGAAFSLPAGMLSDRIGRKSVIVAGYLIFGMVYLGFALAGQASIMWVLFVAYGLYYGLTEGVSRAFAADLASKEWRATGLGAYHTLTGIALLPASLIAGSLWQAISPSAPFFYGAIMALVSGVLMLALVRKSA